jgi:uncharacterized protein (TIGR02996 family)
MESPARPMTEHPGLLRTIFDAPHDDVPRLIYADWLEDNGQGERAEFIRAQVELARLAEDDPRRPGLAARERQLLRTHQSDWKPMSPQRCRGGRLERGFLVPKRWRLPAGKFLALTEADFAAAPLWHIALTDLRKRAAEVARSPLLARLFFLDLGELFLGDGTLLPLVASPFLYNLTVLNLAYDNVTDTVAEAVAASPHLSRLTELDMKGSAVGDAGARALAASPHLKRLHVLRLGEYKGQTEVRISTAGVLALAESATLANLAELNLDTCLSDGDAGVRLLARAPFLPHLRELNLADNGITPAGVRAFFAPARMSQLRVLRLRFNALGDDGVAGLASALEGTAIEHLYLESNHIGDAGARALAAAPFLSRLGSLHLDNNGITDTGAKALAESPHRVAWLSIQRNRLSGRGKALLSRRLPSVLI